MIIEEKGIIISAKKFQENSFIVKCFLESSGIMAGLYKARAGKYAQNPIIGNIVHARWQARLDEHLGFFSFENLKSVVPFLTNNKVSLTILNSAFHLLNLLVSEKDPHTNLFTALERLLDILETSVDKTNILKHYIKFEVYELLSLSGYGLDLSKCVVTGSTENLTYLSPKSAAAVSLEVGKPYHDKLFKLPSFLLEFSLDADIPSLQEAYKLSIYFLEKHLIQPYNRETPIVRKILQDLVLQLDKSHI